MRKIVIISAGLSTPSSTRLLADQISDSVRSQITARGEDVDFTFVELRDLAGELAQAMQTGAMPNQKLDDVKNALSEADALVAVSPVFAASYSGLFKMFFDILDPDARTYRGDGGHAPAFARTRLRHATVVHLLPRERRTHGRVRGDGGFRWGRRKAP